MAAERSPSGLFRMSVWEGDMERSHAHLPRWYRNDAERARRFALWVEAEAEGLAMQLGRHLRGDTAAEVAGPARTLIGVLARDVAWARRIADRPPPGTAMDAAA
ncbi:hypothetical protein [Azospirillum halopraeferens]|uniref:hypothetical protein n=1 Tax=Azospirillum halopraeferens TaxID=34010 RepID=UPI0003F8BDF1|nr:hypothetical protein [Azospirillum halopraeferens]